MLIPFSMGSCSSKKNRDAVKLVHAIQENNIDEVRRLLEEGIDPNVPTFPESKFNAFMQKKFEVGSPTYPLAVACSRNDYEIVKLLIDYGATTDFSDKSGRSPLNIVVTLYYRSDSLRIVELLLENGADVYHKDNGCYPVEEVARMYSQKYDPQKKNGSYVEDGYDEETAKGITQIVKMLLEKMPDYNINEESFTLLMCAAIRGNIDLAEYLLSIGTDKTIKDSKGKTAYDYAIDSGHDELAELLKP